MLEISVNGGDETDVRHRPVVRSMTSRYAFEDRIVLYPVAQQRLWSSLRGPRLSLVDQTWLEMVRVTHNNIRLT